MSTGLLTQLFQQPRLCPRHPSYTRELVCLKKQCIYNSLICSECVRISHNDSSHFVRYLHIFLQEELKTLSCNAEGGNPHFYEALYQARNKVSDKQSNFIENLTNFIGPLLSKIRFAANNQLGNHLRSFDPECYQKELICLSSSGLKDQKIINACYKTQILRKNQFNSDPKLVEQAANKYLQLFEQFQIFLHNWRNKVLQHQYVADLRFSQSNPKQKMNGVRIFQKQNIKQPSEGRIQVINQQRGEKVTINLESEEEGEITDERSRQKNKGVERSNSEMNSNEKRNRKAEKKPDRELQQQRKSESKNEKKQWKRMDASHIYFPMKDESATNLDQQQKNQSKTNLDSKQTNQPFIITPIKSQHLLNHFPIKQSNNNPSQTTNKNAENKPEPESKPSKSVAQNKSHSIPQVIINKSSASKRESENKNQTIKISMKGEADEKQSMGIVFRMKDGSVRSSAQMQTCRNQRYQGNLNNKNQSKVKVGSKAADKQKQKIMPESRSPSVQNNKIQSGQDPRKRQDQTQQLPQQPQQQPQQTGQTKQQPQQHPQQPQQQPQQPQPQPQQQAQQYQQPPRLQQGSQSSASGSGKNFVLINGKKRPWKKPSLMPQQQIKEWFNTTYKDGEQESIILSHRPGSQTNFLWFYKGQFLWRSNNYFKLTDEYPKVQDYWSSLSYYR